MRHFVVRFTKILLTLLLVLAIVAMFAEGVSSGLPGSPDAYVFTPPLHETRPISAICRPLAPGVISRHFFNKKAARFSCVFPGMDERDGSATIRAEYLRRVVVPGPYGETG